MILETYLIVNLMSVLAAVGTAAVILACIFWDDIVNWFRKFSVDVESNPNLVAFSVTESMQSGNYKIVQGIFNKKTEEVVDARRMVSKDIDAHLKQTHSDSKVAVYS